MPEKSKWKNKCFNTSFDDPVRSCEKESKTVSQPPSGILTILGQNIGLLSRKHNRQTQKKYQQELPADKTGSKIKISNLLKFPKTKENKINSLTCQTNNAEKKRNPGEKKKICLTPENNQTKKQTKKGKTFKSKESNNDCGNKANKTSCDELKCKTNKNLGQKKKFRQNEVQKSSITKSNNIDQKLQKSKIRKSKSDSALNEKKRRPLRVNSAQSRVSSGSATTRGSCSSSKSVTPTVKKKPKKPTEKLKKKEEVPALNDQPVVYVNYRYQNRRLVSSRQRHEIYALNQIMTELERDNYHRVCREKGYTMEELE